MRCVLREMPVCAAGLNTNLDQVGSEVDRPMNLGLVCLLDVRRKSTLCCVCPQTPVRASHHRNPCTVPTYASTTPGMCLAAVRPQHWTHVCIRTSVGYGVAPHSVTVLYCRLTNSQTDGGTESERGRERERERGRERDRERRGKRKRARARDRERERVRHRQTHTETITITNQQTDTQTPAMWAYRENPTTVLLATSCSAMEPARRARQAPPPIRPMRATRGAQLSH